MSRSLRLVAAGMLSILAVRSADAATCNRYVATTGSDTAGDGSRRFAEGAGVRCLSKPFSVEEYVQAVSEAWRGVREA